MATQPNGSRRPRADFSTAVESARAQMPRALALEGLVVDGRAVCPSCGTSAKGKTKVFTDGGLHCYRCAHHVGNALDLLTERGWRFSDAVAVLNGDDSKIPSDRPKAELPQIVATESFEAHPDTEVYEAVLEAGDVDAAVEFYGRWHIDADVVRESRATYITDPTQLGRDLVQRFGMERVTAAGLASEKGYLLISSRYPVIEPHILPLRGYPCTAMQMRASVDQEREIREFNAYRAARDAAEAEGRTYEGPKVDYVPKFMSLRGATIASRCGFGLQRLAELRRADLEAEERNEPTAKRRIWIVEGFKDVLAARSMGLEAYGLAGAGIVPVRAVCKLLAQLGEVVVALDGDDAGDDARSTLVEHLRSHGVTATAKSPPPGMDMTDVLVQKRTEHQTA